MPYEFMSDDAIKYRYDGVRKFIEKQEQEQESNITTYEKLS